ncbi:MAG: hypothetical protein AAB368_07810 [bacterium]
MIKLFEWMASRSERARTVSDVMLSACLNSFHHFFKMLHPYYGFMPFVGTRSLERPAGIFPAGFPLRPAPAYALNRQPIQRV